MSLLQRADDGGRQLLKVIYYHHHLLLLLLLLHSKERIVSAVEGMHPFLISMFFGFYSCAKMNLILKLILSFVISLFLL